MITGMSIAVILALAGVFVIGLYVGYEAGVKETERRWSDIVKKAEWNKKYGC